MFEQFLAVLTRIAVALENGAGAAPAAAATESKPAAGKGGRAAAASKPAAPAKTGPTAEETNAALTELRTYIDGKGDKGIVYARKVMDEAAGVGKMADIPEDKREAVIKAAAAELEAYKESESADGDM